MAKMSLFLIVVLTLSLDSVLGQCNWPKITGSDGLCYSGTDGDCSTQADCVPGDQLVCTLGKCQCRNPVNMWFDSSVNLCGIRVGLPCTPNHPTDKCAPEFGCLPDTASMTGYSCKCPSGLPSGGGVGCHKGYMENCTQNECSSMYSERGLACLQGQCQCKNTPAQVWDDLMKKCGGVEGTRCGLTYSSLPCASGLACTKQDGNDQDGICTTPAPATTTKAPATTTKAAATTKKATG